MKNESLNGTKGDVIVSGLDNSQPWCEKSNCEYCKRECYFTPDNLGLVKENAKKICPVCALEKHKEEIPENLVKILEKVVKDFS